MITSIRHIISSFLTPHFRFFGPHLPKTKSTENGRRSTAYVVTITAGMTNASFAELVCAVPDTGLQTVLGSGASGYYVLPDCFYERSLFGVLTGVNLLLLGNASYPDPFARLSLMPALWNLELENCRFYNPEAPSSSPSKFTPNWSVFFSFEDIYYIKLANTGLQGSLPSTLPSSLVRFNVSMNALSGSIPAGIFSNTTFGEEGLVDLSYNALTGTIPAHLMSGTEYLETLDLSSNKLSGDLPPFLSTATPNSFAVSVANNSLTGSLTKELFRNVSTAGYTITFDCSRNKLSGVLPDDLFAYLTNAYFLSFNASRNALTGSIPNWMENKNSYNPLLYGMFFELSHNQISGSVPTTFLPPDGVEYYVVTWNLSSNAISGTIPNTILGYAPLNTLSFVLDLGNNKLNGTLPSSFNATGRYSGFTLSLASNSLTGTVPETLFDTMQKTTTEFSLDLSSNKFAGTFPSALLASRLLTNKVPYLYFYLNVSSNAFNGSLPWPLRQTPKEVTLDFSDNKFSGALNSSAIQLVYPFEYSGSFYTKFSAANNQLTGTISLPANDDSIYYFDVSNNMLTSLQVDDAATNVIALDVSGNSKLTGTVPSIWFTSDSQMLGFAAAHTALSGTFPNISGEVFSPLQALDLSYTAVTFCNSSRSLWSSGNLTRCNLAYTSAHSCSKVYPSNCDTRFTSGSAMLESRSLVSLVLVVIALALFM